MRRSDLQCSAVLSPKCTTLSSNLSKANHQSYILASKMSRCSLSGIRAGIRIRSAHSTRFTLASARLSSTSSSHSSPISPPTSSSQGKKGWNGGSVLGLMAVTGVATALVLSFKDGSKVKSYSDPHKFQEPIYASLEDMKNVSLPIHSSPFYFHVEHQRDMVVQLMLFLKLSKTSIICELSNALHCQQRHSWSKLQ